MTTNVTQKNEFRVSQKKGNSTGKAGNTEIVQVTQSDEIHRNEKWQCHWKIKVH